ncbi:MAG: hypothetical protein WC712_01245 [Candidatus Brocadiia bacterium]
MKALSVAWLAGGLLLFAALAASGEDVAKPCPLCQDAGKITAPPGKLLEAVQFDSAVERRPKSKIINCGWIPCPKCSELNRFAGLAAEHAQLEAAVRESVAAWLAPRSYAALLKDWNYILTRHCIVFTDTKGPQKDRVESIAFLLEGAWKAHAAYLSLDDPPSVERIALVICSNESAYGDFLSACYSAEYSRKNRAEPDNPLPDSAGWIVWLRPGVAGCEVPVIECVTGRWLDKLMPPNHESIPALTVGATYFYIPESYSQMWSQGLASADDVSVMWEEIFALVQAAEARVGQPVAFDEAKKTGTGFFPLERLLTLDEAEVRVAQRDYCWLLFRYCVGDTVRRSGKAPEFRAHLKSAIAVVTTRASFPGLLTEKYGFKSQQVFTYRVAAATLQLCCDLPFHLVVYDGEEKKE